MRLVDQRESYALPLFEKGSKSNVLETTVSSSKIVANFLESSVFLGESNSDVLISFVA